MTRPPKAWSLEATLAAKGKFIVKRRQPLHRDLHGRLLADKGGGGRPSNFGDDDATSMAAKLEPYLLKRKAEIGRLPYRKDEEVLRYARRLVRAAGLQSSDDIITKQIIDPALQKLKPRRRQNF
jgi:hypothetical protein